MQPRFVLLALIALTEWFAIPAQLVIHLQDLSLDYTASLLRFFSYFTILTNILVGYLATAQLIQARRSGKQSAFSPSTETAITLYIVIVGLVYNLLLRQLWDSEGLQAVIHDLLHTLVPLLMLIYWWIGVNTRSLRFSSIPRWLLYPAVYSILVMIHGHFTSWYPYPFLDANKFGYAQVAVNAIGLLLAFSIFGVLLIWIGQRKKVSAAYDN